MASSHRIHLFHLVWSTKNRINSILPAMEERLHAYIGAIIRENKGHLLAIGGISNHIHLLIELSNLDGFTALVRNVKSSSSAWIKKNFKEQSSFAWQDGFGSFSISHSHIDRTREYIQRQKQHHQNESFEDELIKFLQYHGIKFDKQYLFG